MSAQDLQRDLQRLAALHRAQAEAFDSLAANLTDALAVVAQPRLMDDVNPQRDDTVVPPAMLTARQLADLLQIDERTLRELRRSGEAPPAINVGRRLRWQRDAIEGWLAARRAR